MTPLAGRLAACGLALTLLASCTACGALSTQPRVLVAEHAPAFPAGFPTPAKISARPVASAGSLGDVLDHALRAGDRIRFLGEFTADAPAQALGSRLWANWRVLGVEKVTSGPGWGGATKLSVRFRLPGERHDTHEDISVVTGSGRIDKADPDAPVELWALDDLAVHLRGDVVIVASTSVESRLWERWAGAARQAADRMTSLEGVTRDLWGGVLVVYLPHDRDAFRRVTGSTAEELDAVSAVTVSDSPGEPARVLLNPQQLVQIDNDPVSATTLLTHEAVHVVTHAGVDGIPRWVTEGLAETIATRYDASWETANANAVRRSVRSGLPHDPPHNDALLAAHPDTVEVAYAQSEVAVEALIDSFGEARVIAWARDWTAASRPDDATIQRLWLERLQRYR